MIRIYLLMLAIATSPSFASSSILVNPESPSQGDALLVTVERMEASGSVQVELNETRFPLWQVGGGVWKGLAALDRDAKEGLSKLKVLDISNGGETVLGSVEVAVVEKDFPIQRLTVDPSKVVLSDEDLARVLREKEIIRQALSRRTSLKLWRGEFRKPIDGVISSLFGIERYFNGQRRNYHGGLDLAASTGTPVHAPAQGRVALTGDFFFSGKAVYVDHGLGLFTAFYHLDEINTETGHFLLQGSRLGTVGSTGRSTGPHLHWNVYVCGIKVDPLSLMELTKTDKNSGKP